MPLPRFDFAPDEWPPLAVGLREGVADAVFEVEWNGERVEVAARGVVRSANSVGIFFRALASEEIWGVGNQSGGLRHVASGWNAEEIMCEVRRSLECGSYGRAYRYEEEGVSHCLYLDVGSEFGCWEVKNTKSWMARFRLLPGATWQDQMRDETSDIRFALVWSALSVEERLKRATLFSRGSWTEIKQVVRSIIVVCGLGKHYSHTTWRDEGFKWSDRMSNSTFSPTIRLRRWHRHLRDWFRWERDAELSARHLCVAQTFVGPIFVFKNAPTAHEQLEAALFLREWAQGKIPPDELRLLLPKL